MLENFPKGVFFGTTHTYLGQEADAVGVLANLQENDVVFSNHRCHGHFLAYRHPEGSDLRALFAELMGRATGICGGRGGSQHLQWKNFYSNGVQGGIAPVATGMALAEKRKGSGAITVVFLGDGTLGEGAVYEALNLAALWGAPILYVVENNRIAQTTPFEQAIAGEITGRFRAFGIPVTELDSSDVLEILPAAGKLLDEVRSQQQPRALLLHTCRFGPHSKGDDTRSIDEIASLRQRRDPLALQAARLSPEERQTIEKEVDAEIAQAFQQALADPFPTAEQLTADSHQLSAFSGQRGEARPREQRETGERARTVLEAINEGLRQALESDPRVLILGEDVLDPYGGAFKVTRGLSSDFPGRVLTTPISEAGFTGAAAGMALRGLRPVVEIMFGDFITLTADQVINHAAKFRWMYADNLPRTPDLPAHAAVSVPLVIRTPMGGRRGYGPTHSQTLEKFFLGVPGLRVLAPNTLSDPGDLLRQAILTTRDPVLFVENKLLYLKPLQTAASLGEFDLRQVPLDQGIGETPTCILTIRGAPAPFLTIAAYGYMAELARQAMLRLAYEYEVFAELVVPTQLAPFDLAVLLESASRTRRLVTVEEGTLTLGWGAEVLAQAAQGSGGGLLAAGRVAALDLPVPSSAPLEDAVLPGDEEIVKVCLKIVQKRYN